MEKFKKYDINNSPISSIILANNYKNLYVRIVDVQKWDEIKHKKEEVKSLPKHEMIMVKKETIIHEFFLLYKKDYFWIKTPISKDFLATDEVIEILEDLKGYEIYSFDFEIKEQSPVDELFILVKKCISN